MEMVPGKVVEEQHSIATAGVGVIEKEAAHTLFSAGHELKARLLTRENSIEEYDRTLGGMAVSAS